MAADKRTDFPLYVQCIWISKERADWTIFNDIYYASYSSLKT